MNQHTQHAQHAADIDWDQVRRRMSAGEAGLRRALNPEPDDIRAAYRVRARQLVEQPGDGAAAETGAPHLQFALADQKYAIDLIHVAEVTRLGQCTPIPGGPAELAGVISHRGQVRSLLDLARMLGHSHAEAPGAGFCLLLRKGGRQMRVRIDRPEEVRSLDRDDLAPPPASTSAPGSHFVLGVYPDGTAVLSVESLFSHPSAPQATERQDQHQDETSAALASSPTAQLDPA
jgi:purine-binding chemotaxis protein CheW